MTTTPCRNAVAAAIEQLIGAEHETVPMSHSDRARFRFGARAGFLPDP
jgi:hypothetical protein